MLRKLRNKFVLKSFESLFNEMKIEMCVYIFIGKIA